MSDRTNADARDELLRLADALLEEAQSIQRQWAELARVLGEAPAEAEGDVSNDDGPAPARSADVMAVAMARAGRSREETERYLREAFDIEIDPVLLDSIFAGNPG